MPRTAAGLDSVKKSRPGSTSAGSTLLQQSSSEDVSHARHSCLICASLTPLSRSSNHS